MAQLASRCRVVLLPHLDGRQRRVVLGQEARLLGRGGVRAVARVAGVSETTVRSGVFELEAGGDPLPGRRVRRPGGGRRPAEEQDPQLVSALLSLVEPDERGDPVSPLRWTVKSLRTLAAELTRQGHPVSALTVGWLLRGASSAACLCKILGCLTPRELREWWTRDALTEPPLYAAPWCEPLRPAPAYNR